VILHPAVIANLLASAIVALMSVYAASYGVQILRRWDMRSGDELQLSLERKTYLISTTMAAVFGLQLLSLFLYVFTADALYPLFVGAMCAAGSLNVNGFGYPTLLLKIVTFFLAGLWLILNAADNQGYDYPLIKKKYLLLAVVAPLLVLEAFLEGGYFLGLRADVITSCCGSLFSHDRLTGLGSEVASLPPQPMIWIFFSSMLCTLVCGTVFLRSGKGGYVYSGLSALAFVISLASIISFLSLYISELPTHHCPFCIIMREYHSVGSLLYALLFGAALSGIGVGILLPFRGIASLEESLGGLIRRLAQASVAASAAFTAVVAYEIVSSHLIM
jgi:hypothetical protein